MVRQAHHERMYRDSAIVLITLQLGVIVVLVDLFVVGIGAMEHGFMLLGAGIEVLR